MDGAQVSKHNSKRSCWLVINSAVYDVTSFLQEHPGGETVLLRQAGGDASAEFNKIHPAEYVDQLPAGSRLGELDATTAGSLAQPKATAKTTGDKGGAPPLSLCVRAGDFEAAAQPVLDQRTRVFIASSSNGGLSLRANLDDWGRLTFRPRVMRRVDGPIDARTSVLGRTAAYPFYISPMGSLGMAHREAEPELVRGLARRGVHGVISTAATRRPDRIMDSFVDERRRLGLQQPLPGGVEPQLFFQFYMPRERSRAVDLLRLARSSGYRGLWITVDLPVLGKRTADKRLQAEEALSLGEGSSGSDNDVPDDNPYTPARGGRAGATAVQAQVTWDDLGWVREAWGRDGPIVLKGVQCAEDARLAAEHGIDGILLSNHGGRQLHSAPSSLATLLEIRATCPEVLTRLEVYVDGGLRDGADVLKAVCLGACAVGVGRPFFYALAAYGATGVERCIDILADEVETAMRLLGITSLDQARPEMVNASRLLSEMWRPELPPLHSRL